MALDVGGQLLFPDPQIPGLRSRLGARRYDSRMSNHDIVEEGGANHQEATDKKESILEHRADGFMYSYRTKPNHMTSDALVDVIESDALS